MKKFKFRLQNVLEAREKALEDRQLELAVIQSRLREQTLELERLYQKQNNTKESLEKIISKDKSIDFTFINTHQNYIEKLGGQIQDQHKLIINTEAEIDEKKGEVLEALKAKTMLEKLKEKDYKKFLKELEQHESKEIDDIALSRYGKSY